MNIRPFPFFSGALFRRESCFVYLPPGYEQTDSSYPVLYLLHGLHGSASDWWQKGEAVDTIDALIRSNELQPCIVVMPSDGGHGHGTFYLNWYNGDGRFEDYLLEDLIPAVDRTYRTSSQRAIGGFSMGGFGAFMLALRHPRVFQAAVSLSGALGDAAALPYEDFRRSNFAEMVGPQYGEYAKQYSVPELARKRVGDPNRPQLYMTCGKDDYLFGMNQWFHQQLESIGYPHQYEIFEGQHHWDYCKEHLPDALRFVHRIWQ